jgi:hypothetical protein
LQVNFKSPMFWENTGALFFKSVDDPLAERQERSVVAGGK